MSTYAAETGTETLLEKAKRCFKVGVEADADQRKREADDLRFQVPELQWDDESRKQRKGGMVGAHAMPARPTLSVDQIGQSVQRVMNEARRAKLGVSIHPVSEDADKQGAEVRQGLYDRIQRDSMADQARLWALDRATKCGRGVYRISKAWDEESDPKYFDQEIRIERILHQDAVLFDPSAQKPDLSDGEWAFVTAWVPYETFKRKYPKAQYSQATNSEFADIAGREPDWVKGDGDGKACLVAEYWYKEHATETVAYGKKGEKGYRERERDVVTVKWCKLTGAEVLDEEEWDGQYIPLVPVIGRELQPVDSERYYQGMIGPAKDGQKGYNFSASSFVERMASEPKNPWMIAEGQDEGYEDEYLQANVRNLPVVHYKPTALGDKLVGPPQRTQLDSTGMNLAMMGIQVFGDFVQTTTGINAWSLGRAEKNESGRKVLALQQQGDEGTSDFLSSLADYSIPLEARIVLDLMKYVYDRPGRITTILRGDDEKAEPVMINQPYVMDQSGKPVAAQPGQPNTKEYDLRKGGYSVTVSVGKSMQSRLQRGQEELGEMLPNLPPEIQLISLPTYMRFRDTPGAKELADMLTKYRDKQFPFLVDKEGEQPTPEQLQAKVQAMEQQMGEMQQMLQQAGQIIETDQAKQQATIKKAQMDNEAKVAIAQMGTQKEAQSAALDVHLQKMEEAFEARQNAMDRALEIWLAKFKAAHEVGMGAAGGKSMEFQREGGQETGEERESESSGGETESQGTSAETAPEAEA